MKVVTKIIRKVAEQASKLVLFGALVSGVGMTSYATETAVGPTIEKAQLEAVKINLNEVVAAIVKEDPNWVKSLPVVKGERVAKKLAPATFHHIGNGLYVRNPGLGSCQSDDDYPCTITYDDDQDVLGVEDFEYDDKPIAPSSESESGIWQ